MKNRLTDLNDILFAQLERLTDETLSADEIGHELQRTQSVVSIADRIVDTARLQLDAAKLIAGAGGEGRKLLPSTMAMPAAAEAKP